MKKSSSTSCPQPQGYGLFETRQEWWASTRVRSSPHANELRVWAQAPSAQMFPTHVTGSSHTSTNGLCLHAKLHLHRWRAHIPAACTNGVVCMCVHLPFTHAQIPALGCTDKVERLGTAALAQKYIFSVISQQTTPMAFSFDFCSCSLYVLFFC